jgi:pyruvate-formate lyase-activating enzyme
MTGKPAESCPGILDPEQILLSPQGFGPARNIVAFTGGDVLCRPEFYVEVTKKIKEQSDDLWVLLETNGYGLTPHNLEKYAAAGVDSFWLDIKAFYEETYKKLCGTPNSHILESVERIVDMGFTLEVLTLYIPNLVESEEHTKIAELIASVDPEIPTTLLAFFPCYKLLEPEYRPPTVQDMTISFLMMTHQGLKNLRLGNLGVFLKNDKDVEFLLKTLGSEVL